MRSEIKIPLQASPKIISNLKRKLINHIHVLEQTEIKSKRKMLAKTSQHYCQKYSLKSNKKNPYQTFETMNTARKKKTHFHVTLR
jgi:hypothetical protein